MRYLNTAELTIIADALEAYGFLVQQGEATGIAAVSADEAGPQATLDLIDKAQALADHFRGAIEV